MLSYHQLKTQYPTLTEIVAVSKTFPIEAIETVMSFGYSHFGENKAQELKEKAKAGLPVTWHFIGHLQSNKVKDVVRDASWIHSVDSLRLIDAIEKECAKLDKKMNICIQVNLTLEDTKSGVRVNELETLIQHALKCSHIRLRGLMVIGPTNGNDDEIRMVFAQAHTLHSDLRLRYPMLTELSMGMSHDYPLAIENGSTIIRIGSILFGLRK